MTYPKSQELMRQQQMEDRMICKALFDYGVTFFIGLVIGIFGTSLLHWWVG